MYAAELSNNNTGYAADGSATLTFTSEVSSITVPFNMPVGEYLIPVTGIAGKTITAYMGDYLYNNEDESGESGGSGIYEESIADFATGETEFNEEKTYYLYIVNDDNTDYIRFVLSPTLTGSEQVNVVLETLFKFNKLYNSSEQLFEDIFNKVKQLDTNSIFNYTYNPDDNDLISNPLDPKMFWDKNHVFNSYTIAQLDTSSSDNISYRFITSR